MNLILIRKGDDLAMAENREHLVGQRVRKIRERQRLSLRALAEQSGLSANAISLIERGSNSPTVSSLRRLANSLKVPITAFFQDDGDQLTVFVKFNQGERYQSNGIVIESIGTGHLNHQLESFSIIVGPGTGNMDDPISHQGEEFVRGLEGEVEYCVGNQVFRMEVGDSLLFDATQPHCFRNTTQAQARFLIVLHAGEEQHFARQRHLAI
jgi:transcriptional regulator with XRE-family HTH domain